MRDTKNIIGQRIGMLVVQSESAPAKDARGHTIRQFNCQCDCGKSVVFKYNILMRNQLISCGCTKFSKMPPPDLAGKRFHRLTVISEAEPHIQKSGRIMRRRNCVCDCGNEKTILQHNLVNPLGTQSCGCARFKRAIPPRPRGNLVGNRYGKLIVLAATDPIIRSNQSKRRAWLCRCDCGSEVVIAEDNLIGGHTRSCGCLRGHSIKGKTFGMLMVLSREKTNGSVRFYRCMCRCGNEIIVSEDDLEWGTVTDCGCVEHGKQRVDLTGQKYGKLTALREVSPFINPKGKTERAWLCRCECGREVVVRQQNLISKVTRSCGCLRRKRSQREGS